MQLPYKCRRNKRYKIIHYSIVHDRNDVRIFIKELQSLAKEWPGQCALVVKDGSQSQVTNNGDVDILGLGEKHKSRIARMFFGGLHMTCYVLRHKPDFAHFHDPELLLWAPILRLANIKVFFDVHENIFLQIQHKKYIPKILRSPIANTLKLLLALLDFSVTRYVVVDCDLLPNRYKKKSFKVPNYPALSEFSSYEIDQNRQGSHTEAIKRYVVYAGGLSEDRGLYDMINVAEGIEPLNIELVLAGRFDNDSTVQTARHMRGWNNVKYLGWCDRKRIAEVYSGAILGLCILHPTPQYKKALPVKLLEYMGAGLPVIASNFDRIDRLFRLEACGVTIAPGDIASVVQEIFRMAQDEAALDLASHNARMAVVEKYNWEKCEQSLVNMYRELDDK